MPPKTAPTFYKQQGIALITVLMISAIIGVLALMYSHSARQQVQTASVLSDRVQALLLAQSAEAEILFRLLSSPMSAAGIKGQARPAWNFYGKPFALKPTVLVSLQDMSALITISEGEADRLTLLMRALGAPPTKANAIRDSLLDWIDPDNFKHINGAERQDYRRGTVQLPRNAPLQSLSELKWVKGLDANLLARLMPFLTLSTRQAFNPVNAPEALLNLLYDPGKVKTLLAARSQLQTTQRQLLHVLGATGGDLGLYVEPGNLRIFVEAKKGQARVVRVTEIKLRPPGRAPFEVTARY